MNFTPKEYMHMMNRMSIMSHYQPSAAHLQFTTVLYSANLPSLLSIQYCSLTLVAVMMPFGFNMLTESFSQYAVAQVVPYAPISSSHARWPFAA